MLPRPTEPDGHRATRRRDVDPLYEDEPRPPRHGRHGPSYPGPTTSPHERRRRPAARRSFAEAVTDATADAAAPTEAAAAAFRHRRNAECGQETHRRLLMKAHDQARCATPTDPPPTGPSARRAAGADRTPPGRTPRVRLGRRRPPRTVRPPPSRTACAGGRLVPRQPGAGRPCAVPSPRLGLAAALGDVGRQRRAGGHPRPRRRTTAAGRRPLPGPAVLPCRVGAVLLRRPARGDRQPRLRRRGPAPRPRGHPHHRAARRRAGAGSARRPWPAR